MDFKALRIDTNGPVAQIVMIRPADGNVVDNRFLRELDEACEGAADEPSVRVVVLSGENGVFSRGWAPELLAGGAEGPEALFGPARQAFEAVNRLPKPVIAAIDGDALSAGLELALACDVRIASSRSRFALPETELGLLPLAGGGQRLARIAGPGRALAMLLAGEALDAEAAYRAGLVAAVVPAEKLAAKTDSIARRMAERGPLALRYAKEAVNRGLDMTLEQALRYETDLTVILQTTKDRAEGVQAFIEKRPAHFTGE